ncbi:MAG: hypothetical protein HKO07_03080 [Pseudomonadales bacterium]|nr:hypothetical protein [Pseudomonadales bacterium]
MTVRFCTLIIGSIALPVSAESPSQATHLAALQIPGLENLGLMALGILAIVMAKRLRK